MSSDADLRQFVQDHYGQEARRVRAGSAGCCPDMPADPVSGGLYDEAERAVLPAQALQASLGCGNPAKLAELRPGDVVLDLGSGGGVDVLLSARRVSPGGKAYGLDMTGEMLALAEENKARSGLGNVEFLRGEIENIPLPDGSVDVVISNCVINLSSDKDRVLREAFRVLRPGGRFAVSDIVLRGPLAEELRRDAVLWVGCVAGALAEEEYRAKLTAAGFTRIEVQPTRFFTSEDADAFAGAQEPGARDTARQFAGKVMSAFVRATRP